MSEFTGERLVPGAVDANLWNEHISRYAFAASFCSGRERILDAGCGTGYGSNFLMRTAQSVLGIDASHDAIGYATRQYANPATRFAVSLCEALPVAPGSVDLIVAFEVIEHLTGWQVFLEQCQQALSPEGALLVSTPNKKQYTESRGAAGPNPFHVHEFEFAEFSAELERLFPCVRIFGQNHSESIVFTAVGASGMKAQLASLHVEPEQAGFFVAVCSRRPMAGLADFVYVPESANILRRRERHIRLLREELDGKDKELGRTRATHAALVRTHRETIAELERSNAWAESLKVDLEQRSARVIELQAELERSDAWALALDLEARERAERIVALQQELAEEQARGQQAVDRLEAELSSESGKARNAIDRLQSELDSRTVWAQSLDAEIALARRIIEKRTQEAAEAHAELARLRATYWGKAGRALRLVRFPQ